MLRHLDTIAPLAVRQGSAPLSQAHPSRRALTTTAPPHVAPRPQLLIVANFIFSIAEKEYDPFPDNVRPNLSPLLLPLSAAPLCPCPCTLCLACSRRSAHPVPTAGWTSPLPCDPAPLPPNLQTTPAKPAKCLLLKTLHSTRPIHPPTPTLHAPPPQLKKHPQLWITVTAIFNVIFLIELLVNWYGSVWCAATLHPKLESEHQPSS